MAKYAELSINLERRGVDNFAIEWRLARPDSDSDTSGALEVQQLGFDQLPRYFVSATDTLAYGRRLSDALFGIPELRDALTAAKATADGMPLRFRLALSPKDVDLQGLRWETLGDPDAPEPGAPLFMGERVLFSRFVESRDWRSAPRRAKSDLRALVVVANPRNLEQWAPNGVRFTPIDVEREVTRASNGLVDIKVTPLGGSDRATLKTLVERLSEEPDILYLICHGALVEGQPQLWLENEDGDVAVTAGTELVTRLRELRQPPRLVVLISCQSAGSGEGDALGALGPRLGESGIPAVLAMHGDVTVQTVDTFMPVFFKELQKDGQIDRAVARARGAVRERADAWSPVLYMRLKSGSLWYEPSFASDHRGRAYEGWPALLNHIAEGRCTPILGPGMTESLIGPRREIARRWAETYQFPMAPHDQEDLPQVAQFVYVNQQDTTFLTHELRKSVREVLLGQLGSEAAPELRNASVDKLLLELGRRRWDTDPAEPHCVLAQAPFPVFITTTFNSLLVGALKAAGKEPQEAHFHWNEYAAWPRSIYDEEPDYEPTVDRPLIYYLFGRTDVENSTVITEDDYFDYLLSAARNSDVVPSVIRARLAETALIFLGYEMDGWDFRVLFRSFMTYLENPFSRRKRVKIAHAGVQIDLEEGRILKPERAREYIQSYFEESNVHIYWGSVDDFARDLLEQRASSP